MRVVSHQPLSPEHQQPPPLVARCQELEIALARAEERLAAADRLLMERETTIADLRGERDRLLDRGLGAWWRRLALQLRLHEHEPSAPAASLSDGLVRPSPEGPGQDEGRRRRGTGEREPGDQAADLRDAERDEGLAGGSRAPFSLFRPARSPASRASASMARVTCRCQPRQLLTS